MFESRRRSQAAHGGGQNQLKSQYRFNNAQESYASHLTPHVISANKMELAKRAKEKQDAELLELESRKRKLDLDIASAAWHNSVDFVAVLLAEKEAKRQQSRLEEQIKKLRSRDAETLFFERFGPLKPELGALAVLSHSLHTSEEIYNVNTDFCSECSRIVHFDYVPHFNTCLTCRKCTKVLVSSDDVSASDLTHRLPTQQDPKHSQPPRKKGCWESKNAVTAPVNLQLAPESSRSNSISSCSEMSVDSVIVTTKSNDDGYMKSKEPREETTTLSKSCQFSAITKPINVVPYKRYLLQFAHDAPAIPMHVWLKLYASLATVHLLSPLRCKPVTVEKILKDNKLTSWLTHSTRISIMFVGMPLPVFSAELIANLLRRYEELHKAALMLHGHTKSLPGKETLTHYFLCMEQRPDLSMAFNTHKTNANSQAHTKKFWDLISVCKQNAPELLWKYT